MEENFLFVNDIFIDFIDSCCGGRLRGGEKTSSRCEGPPTHWPRGAPEFLATALSKFMPGTTQPRYQASASGTVYPRDEHDDVTSITGKRAIVTCMVKPRLPAIH